MVLVYLMGIQTGIEFRLRNVVCLNKGFLPICIGGVFTQYANTGWLDHVRVDAVVVDKFDKCRVKD